MQKDSDYKDKKWVLTKWTIIKIESLIQTEQEKLETEAKMVLDHQTIYAKRFRYQITMLKNESWYKLNNKD